MDESVDAAELARRTNGYSGDDITNICRDASMNGMRRKVNGLTQGEIRAMSKADMEEPVSMKDFEDALTRISPSVSNTDIEQHEKWLTNFGSA